jgi:molecular chaperone GrpE
VQRCLHGFREPANAPGPTPTGIALRRCYNSSVMDKPNGRDPEPSGAAPSAEAGGDSVEELRRQVEEKQDRLLRALAEAENIRRRSQRDREEYVRYANESLLRDLLPVLDNLDRALGAARAANDASGVVGGVELIHRELLKVLERAGVTRYSALGQPFDPTRHEAIARVVSADAKPGTVVGETLPGYMLHNRVLRPALVSVAAAPDEDA